MSNERSDEQWIQQAEDSLWSLVNGAEGEQEKVDKEGVVHNLHFKLPPNMDAVKFVLKNRSKGKWADKTEVTHTQVNFNLNASYNEVKGILEQQKERAIEAKSINNIQIPAQNEQNVVNIEQKEDKKQ